MLEGTLEWYKDLFDRILHSDTTNYQNQFDMYQLLMNLREDYPFAENREARAYALKISQYLGKMAQYVAAQTGSGNYDDLYWQILLFEAPELLDSYCLYIEKDRKPHERFYAPRRRTLINVCNILQEMQDDELDVAFIHQPPRTGKLLADDTPVLTTKGWKTHGELVVGDYVFGLDGKAKRVLAVSEKDVADKIVTFSNGQKIQCHRNHDWYLFDRKSMSCKVIETKKLETVKLDNSMEKVRGHRYHYQVPTIGAVYGEHKELALSPYLFGAWLGDGTTAKPRMTICDTDTVIIDEFINNGFELTRVYDQVGCKAYEFKGLKEKLREYNLCRRNNKDNKYIPDDYLSADINQRLELLAGLLDTDGTFVKAENRYKYSTALPRLKDDFVKLVSSFGWRCNVVIEKPMQRTKGVIGKRDIFVISFNPTFEIPCRVIRKQIHKFSKQRKVALVSITDAPEIKVGNCIQVEGGVYLVGEQCVPTHNSQLITMGTAWHCAKESEHSNLYVTYKEGLGGAYIDGVMEILTDPTYKNADVFPKTRIARTDAKNHKLDLDRKKKYATLSGKGLESGLNGEYDAYGWMILDDILEGVQDVMNPDVLKRKQTVFDNNVMSRKKEQCKLILNGTIWSLHDIYMNYLNFLENNEQAKHIRYKILKIPALDLETDESNFDYDYGVGFSTEYYRMLRAKFEENDDMAGWFAQYQQEPIEREGALFTAEHMNFYNGVLPNEEPLKIVCACDVALGGSDYLSMPVAYVYEDGSVYIHDVIYDNSEKSITLPRVTDAIIRNKVTNAFFEANAGGEGYKDEVNNKLMEKGYKTNLTSKFAQQMILSTGKHASKTAMRKEQRIWDNAEAIRSFYFRDTGYQNAEYRKFMNNVYGFKMTGKNKHDDAPDSLASLAVFLHKGSGVKQPTIIRNPLS